MPLQPLLMKYLDVLLGRIVYIILETRNLEIKKNCFFTSNSSLSLLFSPYFGLDLTIITYDLNYFEM
jgi:hypothetical protein